LLFCDAERRIAKARFYGPLSSSYCTASTVAATGSLHATVTGRPFDRMVIPHDMSLPTRRAARSHF
jgi:hypothetical protein